jgi:hypothetical protein
MASRIHDHLIKLEEAGYGDLPDVQNFREELSKAKNSDT